MGINLTNFLTSKSKNTRMMDFQDLDHIDGLSISALCADLYKTKRDDLVMFYFCLLYTSPSPRDPKTSRMPSSA